MYFGCFDDASIGIPMKYHFLFRIRKTRMPISRNIQISWRIDGLSNISHN